MELMNIVVAGSLLQSKFHYILHSFEFAVTEKNNF
jgi:hypothetical protein